MSAELLYKLIKKFLDDCELSFHDMDKITVTFQQDAVTLTYSHGQCVYKYHYACKNEEQS